MDKTNKRIEKTCFIITPIGDSGSKIRRHIDIVIDSAIVPALDGKYKPIIPHRLYNSTAITKQIYQHIYESDLVIANLTGLNPNVMYELSMRFCVGKPVIIIAEEETKLPFDIKDQRAFFYVNDYQGIIELKENISKVLDTIEFSNKPSSPIYDALGEIELFKQLKSSPSKDEISDKALSVILEKLDNLESKLKYFSFGIGEIVPNELTNSLTLNEMIIDNKMNEFSKIVEQLPNIDQDQRKKLVMLILEIESLIKDNVSIIPKDKQKKYAYQMRKLNNKLNES